MQINSESTRREIYYRQIADRECASNANFMQLLMAPRLMKICEVAKTTIPEPIKNLEIKVFTVIGTKMEEFLLPQYIEEVIKLCEKYLSVLTIEELQSVAELHKNSSPAQAKFNQAFAQGFNQKSKSAIRDKLEEAADAFCAKIKLEA